MKYPVFLQMNKMDCAPTCIRMISKYYGRIVHPDILRKKCFVNRSGVSLWQMSNAATEIGLRSLYAKISFEELKEINLPCIIHWGGNHFVVLYKIGRKKIVVGDPAVGTLTYDYKTFLNQWSYYDRDDTGIILTLEPTPAFYLYEETGKKYIGFKYFFYYLLPFKRYYVQLFIGMLVGLLFSIILPFLTQAIIDQGINNKNIGFIELILIAQIVFTISSSLMGYIRSWIFLHVTSRINIALISDYLLKLLKLPISFFESRTTGDILQRIGDHSKVQSFISANTLSILFSFINLFVFTFLMASYSLKILFIFLFFSITYAIWTILFLKKRKEFNYKFFDKSAQRQNILIQLISGIRDIKLHNYEDKKRWEWERVQIQTLKITIKQMIIGQLQSGGGLFINTTKGIIIYYLSAKAVIEGQMTLGMMMSMQYILAQINGPISHFTGLINSFQDAKISLERIGEIHANDDEDADDSFGNTNEIPTNADIVFDNVSFSYTGSKENLVLKNLNFSIPRNKVTAIVGESGSGKTTLLKLLLKFYTPISGEIKVGNIKLKSINSKAWRDCCGSVMQDGFIFSDTVAENIALGDEEISFEKLEIATDIANISSFIKEMPYGYNTKIGSDGTGVSQGQKQRLLIARAVYKDPKFLFFDEATNSLDSKNESEIVENLNKIFLDKTVVLIAHRLSSIRNADQILVVKDGEICEAGTHQELLEKRGEYYLLISKQANILD